MKSINIPMLIITVYLFSISSSACAEDVWYKDATSLTNALLLSKEEKKELGLGDTSLLKKASTALKQDKKLVFYAVKLDPRAFQYADESLRKDKAFVITLVQEHGFALKFADSSLRKDKEVVLAAVLENGSSLEFADESMKKNKEVVITALKNSNKYSSLTFQWADNSFRNDKDVMLVVVGLDGSLLRFSGNKLKKDKEVVLAAVLSISGARALEYADDTLLKNRDFLLSIARKLYAKKEVVFQGKPHNLSEESRGALVGAIVERVDDSLKNDKQFVKDIVAISNIFSLLRISKKLKKNEELMLKLAEEVDLRALLFVDESLLESHNIMRELDFLIMQLVDSDEIKFKELKIKIITDIRKASSY